MTIDRDEFREDLGSVTIGRLVFSRGMSNLKLHTSDSDGELYRARFEGVVPEVRVNEGVITVEYPNVLNPLKWRRISADIGLNPTIPWRIEVRGGAAGIVADLAQLHDVEGFTIAGGVSDVELGLPTPSGQTPVEITGGVNALAVRRPRNVAASLGITGGATNLTFDEQQFGAIGGKVSLESTGYDDSAGRYEVSVAGGANNISLTTA